jgi:hypothetical protein
MTTSLRCLLAGLALTAAASAFAESAPRTPTRGTPSNTILAILDADRNGVLSADEIAVAPVVLTALDLNDDGIISADERAAGSRANRGPRGAAVSSVLLQLDVNHDGAIQAMEVTHAASSLKRLDRNGDGQVTSDELRPTMVARA